VGVVADFDQQIGADVVSRDVDRGWAGRLEHPQRAVALGDRLPAEHDPHVTIERLDVRRPRVVPDAFPGSLRLHLPESRGTIQRYA
jgi:hypothetical protein